MSKAVFIVKPDYLNPDGIKDFLSRIKEHKVKVDESHLISNFYDFSYFQRMNEIMKIEDEQEAQKKLEELSYTIEAYKYLYPENVGLCVITSDIDDESEDDFYKKASSIKKEIRYKYVKNREKTIFTIHDEDGFYFKEDLFANYEQNIQEFGENHVNLAYLNCIHLEDYDSFVHQDDLSLVDEYGLLETPEVDIVDYTLKSTYDSLVKWDELDDNEIE